MEAIIETLKRKIYLTFITEDRWQFFTDGLVLTLFLVIGSFIFGTICGIISCALKMSKHKWVRKIINGLNWFLVEVPTTVLLMIFAYVIFQESSLSGAIIAIFCFAIKQGAYMADIFYTAINSVNSGEGEAARSLGLSKAQAFFNVILPQSIHNALPLYQNQFVLTLQDTSVVGYIALHDLTRASSVITARTYDAIFSLVVVSILYIIIGWIATKLLSLAGREHHLKGGDFND